MEERQKKANRAKIGRELIVGSMPTVTGKAPRVYLQVPVMPLLDDEQEHGDLETRAEGSPISHGHSEEQVERGTCSDGVQREGAIYLGKGNGSEVGEEEEGGPNRSMRLGSRSVVLELIGGAAASLRAKPCVACQGHWTSRVAEPREPRLC